jgi:hypothetical protein
LDNHPAFWIEGNRLREIMPTECQDLVVYNLFLQEGGPQFSLKTLLSTEWPCQFRYATNFENYGLPAWL